MSVTRTLSWPGICDVPQPSAYVLLEELKKAFQPKGYILIAYEIEDLTFVIEKIQRD